MSRMSKWLKEIERLLAPPLVSCLICGKRSAGSSRLPDVCPKCTAAIPWIRYVRCTVCGRHIGCPDCSRAHEPTPLICNRSAVAYNHTIRELIGQYKYRGNEKYASLLGLMLDQAYSILAKEREQILLKEKLPASKGRVQISFIKRRASTSDSSWKADLLVPVPVSEARLAERGFNQAEQIGAVISSIRAIPQLPLLIRRQHTSKQSFKSRSERLTDMKNAFAADPGMKDLFLDLLEERHRSGAAFRIIIVDDIYTTGSTVRACAKPLQQWAEAWGVRTEIYSLTLSRS